jgi:hypothetical protein
VGWKGEDCGGCGVPDCDIALAPRASSSYLTAIRICRAGSTLDGLHAKTKKRPAPDYRNPGPAVVPNVLLRSHTCGRVSVSIARAVDRLNLVNILGAVHYGVIRIV